MIRNHFKQHLLMLFIFLFTATVVLAEDKISAVKVGVFQLAPLVYIDNNGIPQGVFVDVIEAIASEEGWKVDYVKGTWDEGLGRIRNGMIDLMTAVMHISQRESFLDFHKESISNIWGQVYIHKDAIISGVFDMEGKTVGVLKGGANGENFIELLSKLRIQGKLISFDSQEAIAQAVKEKRVDAGVFTNIHGYKYQQSHQLKQTQIVFDPSFLKYATAEGTNQQLLSTIDRYLSKWKNDQNSPYYKIIEKHLSLSQNKENPDWGAIAIIGVSIIGTTLLVVLFLMIFNQKLKKEVENSTQKLVAELDRRKNTEKELKKNEEAIKRSELMQSKMVANIGDVITIIDQDGINRYKSTNIERLFGWKPEDVVGASTWENIHPDDLDAIQEFFEKLMSEPGSVGTTECRYRCKDGRYSWIEFTGTNLLHDPDINGLLGNYHDITERKQVEEALKENEYLFKESQRAAVIGSYKAEFSPNDRWVTSEVLDQILGMDDNYNRTVQGWTELLHPDSAEEMIQYVTEDVIGKNIPFNKEYKIIRQTDGETRWVLGIGKTILDDEGTVVGLIGTIQDITQSKLAELEREMLQSQLAQAQKMESIGNLAGGIAHDFNNLLFPIIGMSEMLLEDLPKDSLEHKNAKEIFHAGNRAGKLVKQILAFSRQSEHKMTPVRIQKILKEVLKLSHSTIPSNIEIQENIDWNCGLIMADATQIHQLAMNLITNAFHAIEEKNGIIDVTLKEIELKNGEIPDSLLHADQYIQLSVSDNGGGMSQRTQNKIFDPYFTTKKKGKGTGLGLAVVYGIIKEHKGDINVYSEEGKGSSFNVYLPLMKTNSTPALDNQSLKIPTGTEKILLVDDEISVAKLEGQMLSRLGYHVTEQTNSSEAFNEFKMNPENFDLVISDMTMPNMTGDQLAKEILSIKSDMPIIICTGFSERVNKEQSEVIGVKGFLMKPVVKYDMAQMVRNVLDEAKIS